MSHSSSLGLRSQLDAESPLAVRLRRQRNPRRPDADEQAEEGGDFQSDAIRYGMKLLHAGEDEDV